MPDFDAAVRRHDGTIERYVVEQAQDWIAARTFVFFQITPPPLCVLVSERVKAPEPEPLLVA